MSDYLLIALLFLLFLLFAFSVFYPLRGHKRLAGFVILLSLPLLISVYLSFGGYRQWREHQQQLAAKAEVMKILDASGGPMQLIHQLEEKVKSNPSSAKGWYLLGKLYAGQGMWTEAVQSYRRAYRLEPSNEAYAVFYGEAYWQFHHQQMDKKLRRHYQNLLEKNAEQPDALAMLAMDAYSHQQYPKAIDYWQRLLILAPAQSEEAAAIRKAITEAKAKI